MFETQAEPTKLRSKGKTHPPSKLVRDVGERCLERQRDAKTHERKYRIRGVTRSVRPIELVVRLGPGGKLVIITVYDPRGKP